MKITILLLSLITISAYSMDRVHLKQESIHVPGRLGNIDIYRTDDGFQVEKDGQVHEVQNYRVSPLLKKFSPKTINRFLDNGYITVNQSEDGDYSLDGNVRIKGGFLLTGVIVHQACRVLGYSGLVLASGSTVVAGFVSGGPIGASIAISGVIASAAPAAAAIETGSLAIGVAASWIPVLP